MNTQSIKLLRWVLAIYWLALAIATHWPRLAIDMGPLQGLHPDKLAHFGAYIILTILLVSARPFTSPTATHRHIYLGCVIAALYGVLDECSQLIPFFGRTFDWADLVGNLLAVFSVFLGYAFSDPEPQGRRALAYVCRAALGMLVPFLTVMALTPGLSMAHILLPVAPRLNLSLSLAKLAHVLAVLLLTWLLAGARIAGLHRPWLSRLASVLIVGTLIPALEYAQRYTGRHYRLSDIILGYRALLAAVVIGLAFVGIIYWFKRQTVQPRRAWDIAETPSEPAGLDGQSTADDSVTAPASPPASPTAQRPATTGFVSAAMTVSLLTFLSRITGLIRDSYLTGKLGLSPVSDAFWFGFNTPNLFRRLFGEGAMTAAFIPVYSDLLQRDREMARRFASLCIALACIVLGTLTILGELILTGVLFGRNWTTDSSLSIQLTMIMLPYMPLVCLVAIFGGVLQVHGRFAPSAGMPIFLNLVMIAGTWYAASGLSDPTALRGAVYVISFFVVIAGLVQLVTQLTAMLRHESLTLVVTGAKPAFQQFWYAFVPSFLALSVFQINTYLDNIIALGLSAKAGGPTELTFLNWSLPFPIDPGGLTALNNAQRLYQFPLGVFGLAIATAIFPALARAAAEHGSSSHQNFQNILHKGLRMSLFIGLPASVGLVMVSLPLTRTIFEHHRFTLEDSRRVSNILIAYAPAIWAYSMTHILTRAFYAVQDTRTPLALSLLMVGMNLVLNLTLVWPLGAAGLAVSTAICAIVQCLLMLHLLRHHVDQPVDRGVLAGWLKTAALTVAMALVIWPILQGYDSASLTRWQTILQLAAAVGAGLLVFGLGAWGIGCQEINWLRRKKANKAA